jgi:hypothetical protein
MLTYASMLRFFGQFFVKSEPKLNVLRRFKFSAIVMLPPSHKLDTKIPLDESGCRYLGVLITLCYDTSLTGEASIDNDFFLINDSVLVKVAYLNIFLEDN